jgi:hypothetical protein
MIHHKDTNGTKTTKQGERAILLLRPRERIATLGPGIPKHELFYFFVVFVPFVPSW